MDKTQHDLLVEILKSVFKIEIPKFEKPFISNYGLVIKNEDTQILFKNGYYDKSSKILFINNGETFEGELAEGNNIYTLIKGTYKWPSGQQFIGEFLKNGEYQGTLTFSNGYIFEGKFQENFNGKGKLTINDHIVIKGNLIEGKINGEATIENQSFSFRTNFVDSRIEGEVKEFNIIINNILYKFPNFHYRDGYINEHKLIVEKNNQKIPFINKEFSIKIDYNRNNLIITDKELESLINYLNIPNELIPEIESPSIPNEGLITLEDNFEKIIFQNGIEAIYDEENDAYILKLPNEERFEGLLNDNGKGKYWIEKGKYIWPSGQEYEGDFNEKNKFNSDAKLKTNSWSFNGAFKNGYITNGKFEWIGNNKSLESYFLDGKINGNTTIQIDNITINGVFTESYINEFEAIIDGHSYKISKLDKKITEEDFLYIEKDDKEYFLLGYSIINHKITIEKIMDRVESNTFLDILNEVNNIDIPFDKFSYGKLIMINDIWSDTNDENIIHFKDKIKYNKKDKILYLPNKERFQGVLNDSDTLWNLDCGEYKWPSGQKYRGTFNKNNNFEGKGNLIGANNYEINGKFQNGNLNENCEINYENGDYIKANFENGNMIGDFELKKNDVILKGNYKNLENKETFKDNKLSINGHIYQIPEINISKAGFIIENTIKVKGETDFELKIGQIIKELNENEIILLFQYLSKIRKINISNYTLPIINVNNLIIKEKNFSDNNNIKLTFQNNETFRGAIKKADEEEKYYLVDGQYDWPSGQQFIGKFKENKFHTEKGELKFEDNSIYNGEFKEGFIEGNGVYENQNGEKIGGYFEKGEIKKDIKFKSKNIYFEGDIKNSIKRFNIKFLKAKINGHNYEINEFKITDDIIIIKKDDIIYKTKISKDLKTKMVESLIIKSKPFKNKFFYNESNIKQLCDNNKLNILKIQDNIQTQKLSKMSVCYQKLCSQNKKNKVVLGKILGVNLPQIVDYEEIMVRLRLKHRKVDLNYFPILTQIGESHEDNNYDEIEEKEILRICNNKMLKNMEEEIYYKNKDINTLKKEKEILVKEKENKTKELQDINILCDVTNENYKELKKKKCIIEEDTKIIEENLKNVKDKNNNIEKYLNSLKIKDKNTNNNVIKKFREMQNKNSKILKEIKEKEEIINKDRREIENLQIKIKELEDAIEKKKK